MRVFPPHLWSILFQMVLFFYFVTLSADLFHLQVGLFKIKINHLVALFLGAFVLLHGKIVLIDRQLMRSFFFILGSLSLSACLSSVSQRCLGYILVYLFDFLFYFLVPLNLFCRGESSRLFGLYNLSFVVIGLFALFQLLLSLCGLDSPLVSQSILSIARPQGLSYEPSYYALYMTSWTMYWNARQLMNPGWSKKTMFLWVGVNSLLLVSTTVSGLFAYFIFFAVCGVFALCKCSFAGPLGRNLFRYAALFLTGFMLVASLFWTFFLKSFFKFFSVKFFLHHSFAERWASMKNCWGLFCDHPFFGVGLGGISPTFFHEIQGNQASYELEEIASFEPSNLFTEILASLGLVGCAAFALLVFYFSRKFSTFLKNPSISEEQKRHSTALFLSLITVILVLQFNQGLFRSYIWVHAALLYGSMSKPVKLVLQKRDTSTSFACGEST